MYLRPVHTDLDLPTLYDFIHANPLGVLTTALPSPNHRTIQSSHIPWVLDIPASHPSSDPDTAPIATLRGHLARANPQTKALIEAITSNQASSDLANGVLEGEVMVLFNGPVHHYVTPKFYVKTKPSTGKVVPTWNYSAVQAYGKAKIFFSKESSTGEFLTKQIDDLSRQSEEGIMGFDGKEGRREAWTVEQAPEKYVELLKKAIIGIEIEVTSLAGKWKMSQELEEGDRDGTVKGFEGLGSVEGKEIARVIEERAEIMKARKVAASA